MTLDDAEIKVMIGTLNGCTSPTFTFSPAFYYHVTLPAGGRLDLRADLLLGRLRTSSKDNSKARAATCFGTNNEPSTTAGVTSCASTPLKTRNSLCWAVNH